MDANSVSNREMRDQVLALLLSGQKSTRTHHLSPPTTSRRRPSIEHWTGYSDAQRVAEREPELRLSPVTPEAIPLDADVRLAEITAGLVAASDKERRQTDTIRRLALQLEQSENRIRHLKGDGDEGTRRRSGRRRRLNVDDMFIELEELRRERKEWMKKEKIARKEARAVMSLLSDVQRSVEKVVAERDGYLRMIASLQQQLYEAEPRASPGNNSPSRPPPYRRSHTPQTHTSPPPQPAFSETAQSGPEGNTNAREPTAQSVLATSRPAASSPQSEQTPRQPCDTAVARTGSLPDMSKTREAWNGADGLSVGDDTRVSVRDDTHRTESDTKGEMYRDLHELLTENKELRKQLDAKGEENNEQLLELEEELGVLEAIVEVMELSLDTEEAKEMQRTTLSQIFDTKRNRRGNANALDLEALVRRVSHVHQTIATKYGQFLSGFRSTTDESVSLPPGNTLQSYPDSTDISLSRTVLPPAPAPAPTPTAAPPPVEDTAEVADEGDVGELE